MKELVIILATLTSLVISADDAVSSSKDVEIIAPKDKSLYIRSIPGIFGHSSSIYDIPIHPYRFVSILLGLRQARR
jgi:hypothetical protein